MYLRILVEKARTGAELNQDLLDRALGELLEIEKTRDILVIAGSAGHFDVPFTEGFLKQLRQDIARGCDIDYFIKQVKAMGGSGLIDEHYHNASFYSHVVVFSSRLSDKNLESVAAGGNKPADRKKSSRGEKYPDPKLWGKE